MSRRQAFLHASACLALLVLSSVSFGDSPLLHVSEAEYAQFPVWQPEPEATSAQPRVDLRPFLPPVGNQGTEGSCVGWALGYTAKTHFERRKRNWRLNTPEHLFSPAFIYNQLNQGKDRGCHVKEALDLLVSKGCASLATMPYKDGDYRSKPTATATSEAARYRTKGWATLQTSDMVRAAVRQHNVVVLTIRPNKIFLAGKFRVFTPQEHRANQEKLAPGAQHVTHALAIAGYDDARGAFLVMNSWGEKWGERGFCWIDYKLLKTINPKAGNFAVEAYVLLDRKPQARRTMGTLSASAQLLDLGDGEDE